MSVFSTKFIKEYSMDDVNAKSEDGGMEMKKEDTSHNENLL